MNTYSANHKILGSKMIFAKGDEAHGNEVWVYDLESREMQLLYDLNPGPANANPAYFTVYSDKIFFIALETNDIWKTDGTIEGTQRVSSAFADQKLFFEHGGMLLGTGRPNNYAYHLIASGGNTFTSLLELPMTELGSTTKVVASYVQSNDYAIYILAQGVPEIWSLDRSLNAQELGEDLGSVSPFEIRTAGEKFYFVASRLDDTQQFLFVSDGTPEGTRKVTEKIIEPQQFILAGQNLICFSGEENGPNLWFTDGTDAGTRLLSDTHMGIPTNRYINSYNEFRGYFYFALSDEVHGEEVWRTDGTKEGTTLVADINPGSGGSTPRNFFSDGQFVYFSAFHPDTGFELYRTDGTEFTLIEDVLAGPEGSNPRFVQDLGNFFTYFALDANGEYSIWKLDKQVVTSTENNTEVDLTLYPNPVSSYIDIKFSAEKDLRYLITTVSGKKLKQGTLESGRILVEDLPEGIYLIHLDTGEKRVTQRIIKF
jgi:ELWxxDGT repeat protein